MMKNLSQSLQTYLKSNNQHFSSQFSVLNNVNKIDIVQLLASAASQSIQSNILKQKYIQQGTTPGTHKINISEMIQQWNKKPKNQVNKFLNDNAQIALCSIIRTVQPIQQTNQSYQDISNQQKQSIKKDDQLLKNKQKQQQRQRQRQYGSDSYSSVKRYHNRQHTQSRNIKNSRQYEKQDNKSRDSAKIYYEKQRNRSRQKNNQRQRNLSRDPQPKYYKSKQRDNWDRQRQRQRQRQRERQREWERERQKQKQRQREYKQKQRYYDYKTPTYRDTRYYTTNNTNNLYRFQKNENPNNIYNQGGQHRKFIQNRQSLYHQYSNQYYDYYHRDKRYQ